MIPKSNGVASVCVVIALVGALVGSSASWAGELPSRINGPSSAWSDFASIPDNNATGVTIDLPISGALYPLADVSIQITMLHSWVGDVEAVLESPNNGARLRLFSRAGYRKSGSVGSSSNLNGTYTFDDYAVNDLWTTIAPLVSTDNVPGTAYRTSTRSRVPHGSITAQSSSGGCTTYLSGAFGGLAPVNVNGTWKLKLYDHAGGDTGSVSQVLLTVHYPALIYRTGFETFGNVGAALTLGRQMTELGTSQAPIAGSSVRGTCRPAQYDTDGDGWSDFVLVDPDEGDGDSEWWVRNNDGTAAGATSSFLLGDPGVLYLMDDFDGDGADDAAVWYRSADATFQVRRSSRSELVFVHFGSDGVLEDEPAQSGDYDGDNVADLTVFRAPAAFEPVGFAEWRVATSKSGGNDVRVYSTDLLGTVIDFDPAAGFDSTGDGVADLTVEAPKVGDTSVGHWTVFSGATGLLASEFDFDTALLRLVPGNHVGNFQADATVINLISGIGYYSFRDGQTGATSGPVIWGGAGDFLTPGDYDGDGLDDLAVWSPSTAKFYVRRSTDTGTTFEVPLGVSGYVPVASSRVH